jgi:D-ribose pyranose/furanose isomerase RbsD
LGKCTQGAADFLSILDILSERMELEDLALAAMVAQQIWHLQNKFVFEGATGDPRCLLKCPADSLADYRLAR